MSTWKITSGKWNISNKVFFFFFFSSVSLLNSYEINCMSAKLVQEEGHVFLWCWLEKKSGLNSASISNFSRWPDSWDYICIRNLYFQGHTFFFLLLLFVCVFNLFIKQNNSYVSWPLLQSTVDGHLRRLDDGVILSSKNFD